MLAVNGSFETGVAIQRNENRETNDHVDVMTTVRCICWVQYDH